MSVQIFSDTWEDVEFITFSDGCETCNLPVCYNDEVKAIRVNIYDCNRDLMRLALVKDTLDHYKIKGLTLYLSYFPNARADRRFKDNMPHPLKVTARLINSLGFSTVVVEDPHSDVVEGLIDNILIVKQEDVLRSRLPMIQKKFSKDFTLVAPDLGAAKKIHDVNKMLTQRLGSSYNNDYIQGIKIRDVVTGDIIKCDILPYDVTGMDLLIVDDIADGGASFKFLAKKLKELGANRVGLYVTHGIFSKGLDVLKPYIDYVCANNIIGTYINEKTIQDFNNKVGE